MVITVIGAAGGVGQALVGYLKTYLPAGSELRLLDRSPSGAGVAMDLSHIPNTVGVKSFLFEQASEAIQGSDIVVITAGSPRKPGMTREDLFLINASIVRDLTRLVAENAPEACLAIVTNPLNSMVPVAAKTLEKAGVYNPKKLFGITQLDTIRAQVFAGAALQKNPAEIEVDVIGGHSGKTILPILSQISGNTFTPELRAMLREQIQNAGTAVVEAKAGQGSATLSMGYAGMQFVMALVQGLSGTPTRICAYIPTQKEKLCYFAKPILLGPEGIQNELDYGLLSADEQKAFDELLSPLQEEITKGEEFMQ